MLRLPSFEYLQPTTVEQATAMLRDEGASEDSAVRVVAGGTDLWPNMKRRHQQTATAVSLMQIPELRGIVSSEGLTIGAATLLSQIEQDAAVRAGYPGLATAVGAISSPPLRNMGTLGGNICVDTRCTYYNQTEEWRRSIDYCMKEEGEICWVAPSSPRCWAHSASDSAPMLIALGAEVDLVSTSAERRVPVAELYADDGIDYLRRKPDEIVTAVQLPDDAAMPECRSAFWKLRRRGSIDFAVLSVAVAAWLRDDETVKEARIVLGAVSSRPVLADDAAEALVGQRLDPEAIAAVAKLTRKPATPMDNTDFQAQWRGLMVERYTEAALREVAGLPISNLPPGHPRVTAGIAPADDD